MIGETVLSSLLDAPLIAGLLPTVISAAGAVAAVSLLAGRGRRWWVRTVPVCAVAGVGVAALAAAAGGALRPFPDPLPPRVLFWIAVAAAAIGLASARRSVRYRGRVVLALALVAVVATSTVKINAFYGYRPTLAGVLGLPAANEIDIADVARPAPLVTAPAGVPMSTVWHSPHDMPAGGRITHVDLPGRVSRFPARPAWVYLPPAYLASPRPRLPVLVMVPGQPGGPEDWLIAGHLAEVLDRFAAAHDGLAPVVVVPDVTGSSFGNSLCLDSRLGAAETYLAVDVPAWLAANLQVDSHRLAIGGFSFGGTCALQLAVRRPEVYPSFLDIAGQAEPTLGDHARTVRVTFGGDEAAFRAVNPVEELRTARYPVSAGLFAVGHDDPDFRSQAHRAADAARGAGMSVGLVEYPGGHSWSMATEALERALPWLAGRGGILDPASAPLPR